MRRRPLREKYASTAAESPDFRAAAAQISGFAHRASVLVPMRPTARGRTLHLMAAPAAYHALPAESVSRLLRTDSHTGLSEAEARARLESGGPNLLPEPKAVGPLRIAARQFADPLVGLLVAAAVVSAGIASMMS